MPSEKYKSPQNPSRAASSWLVSAAGKRPGALCWRWCFWRFGTLPTTGPGQTHRPDPGACNQVFARGPGGAPPPAQEEECEGTAFLPLLDRRTLLAYSPGGPSLLARRTFLARQADPPYSAGGPFLLGRPTLLTWQADPPYSAGGPLLLAWRTPLPLLWLSLSHCSLGSAETTCSARRVLLARLGGYYLLGSADITCSAEILVPLA